MASRAAKERCDAGYGVNATGEAVFLDFASAIQRYGKEQINIKGLDENDTDLITSLARKLLKQSMVICFQMYEKITDDNPYETPMKIFPCGTLHYGWNMGRL